MRALIAVLLGLAAGPAAAALEVFACTPEWAALARELGGERVSVYEATSARQDPHRIEARPALLARARRADLLVCTGAELEAGWLPLLQRESGNPRIQSGRPGYFEAAAYVELLEKPAALDRSLGDIHAAGNPHIHLDPRNLLKVADALARRLAELSPKDAVYFESRHRDFSSRMREAIARWEREAAPLRGVPVVTHHRHSSYLLAWLGMKQVADLEPLPGVEPSVGHLAKVVEQLRTEPARMVLRVPYQSPRPSEWVVGRVPGMRAVELPFTVGGSERAKDLFGLFDDTLARLLAAVRG